MVSTISKSKQNEITPLYRVELKSNQNLVIWQVSSESGHTYNVSLLDGKVAGCQREDGEECKGFHFRHSCHHVELATRKEMQRQAPKGTLNGNQGFSLMR
jgi:hypothetical protein